MEATVNDGWAANKLQILLEQRDELKARQSSLRQQLVCSIHDCNVFVI